ncbi:MAG TPA: GNAT family N-acetyltransferase [Candidatus Dormibacteraeota bacterium]
MQSWLTAAPPEEIDIAPARLRRWRVEDAEEVARLVTDNLDHLRPWMPWAQEPPSVEQEREFLQVRRRAWEARTDFGYAVTLSGGQAIGGMGLHTRQGPRTLEIGYWIAAAHTGRGFATAGARALTAAALGLPGVERVEIRCDEANRASAAVPARLGFRLVDVITREPSAPGETSRAQIWAVRREEWHPGVIGTSVSRGPGTSAPPT